MRISRRCIRTEPDRGPPSYPQPPVGNSVDRFSDNSCKAQDSLTRMAQPKGLTPRQKRFVEEYPVDLNAAPPRSARSAPGVPNHLKGRGRRIEAPASTAIGAAGPLGAGRRLSKTGRKYLDRWQMRQRGLRWGWPSFPGEAAAIPQECANPDGSVGSRRVSPWEADAPRRPA